VDLAEIFRDETSPTMAQLKDDFGGDRD